jgi:hypothetical protein
MEAAHRAAVLLSDANFSFFRAKLAMRRGGWKSPALSGIGIWTNAQVLGFRK